MNISIFGLGYVGCISLGCLAKNGHQVVGVDVNMTKVNLINAGKPTIIEKDIDNIIRDAHEARKTRATNDAKDAVINSEISIICVGTPSTDQGHLNLDYIFKTAEQIAEGIKAKDHFHVLVIRSTVLPGTNFKVGEIVESVSGKKRNKDFAVVSNPEFLREGSSVKDYYNPAVTVIGSDNEKAIGIMKEIYKEIQAPIATVSIQVAELIKYINNAFHALKITFANEVGNICKQLDIDSHAVMDLFCMDDHLNLSAYYFKPGFAYGGSCLPKDLKALKTLAHDFYLPSPIIESIEVSNSLQKKIALDMILAAGKKKVGILGLSFKKGTDDLRYSPIVEVTENLLGKGFSISIFDENVNLSKITGTNKEYIDQHIPHLSDLIDSSLEAVIDRSEILVITQKDKRFSGLAGKYPEKRVIDFARIDDDYTLTNYSGICW